MRLNNITNENRKAIEQKGPFTVLEYEKDLSILPDQAITEFFKSEMNVKKRQIIAVLKDNNGIITQAGAMQWTLGDVNATTGVKGAGDLIGKIAKSAVTKESTLKPEYKGTGYLMLEPTYKYLLLEDLADWPTGLVVDDGLFYTCENTVSLTLQRRSNLSSLVAGKEGIFNTKFVGSGIVVLESYAPRVELIEVELNNETLKIDGNFAVAWSGSLEFTVERSSKSLIGSAVNGEGLVNVYRGTGRVLMSPVCGSSLFMDAIKSENT